MRALARSAAAGLSAIALSAAGGAAACPFHGAGGDWGDSYAYAGGPQRYSPFAYGLQPPPPPAPPPQTQDAPAANQARDGAEARDSRAAEPPPARTDRDDASATRIAPDAAGR